MKAATRPTQAQISERLYSINIEKRLPKLRVWLAAAGAEILEPTNEWEVLRYRSNGGTSIVYKNKAEQLTFTGDAEEALRAYLGGRNWRANQRTKRVRGSSSPVIRTLRQRDGDDCFACCWPVAEDDESHDHLVELTAGGPNHISNYVLMHQSCNAQCSQMSAPEKVRMHVEARIARLP